MNLKKLALVGSLALFLNACATTNNETLPSPGTYENPAGDVLVCKLPLQLESIPPIDWRDYEWTVLNNDVVQAMIDEGADLRYYALTPQEFQNLSLTQQDILRFLRVQREQLEQTREYYSPDITE